MAFSPYRKLRLEHLESRFVPSGMDTTTLTAPPPSSGLYYIDPTLSPSDPTSTNVQVTIVSVGTPAPGTQNVTVAGLSPANLQPGASIQFIINGSAYVVNSFSAQQNGTYQLTLLSDANLANNLSQATTATVTIGGGGNVTPTPTPTPPPSQSPIIDPTLDPQG
jgi:hypothetical protein